MNTNYYLVIIIPNQRVLLSKLDTIHLYCVLTTNFSVSTDYRYYFLYSTIAENAVATCDNKLSLCNIRKILVNCSKGLNMNFGK